MILHTRVYVCVGPLETNNIKLCNRLRICWSAGNKQNRYNHTYVYVFWSLGDTTDKLIQAFT